MREVKRKKGSQISRKPDQLGYNEWSDDTNIDKTILIIREDSSIT